MKEIQQRLGWMESAGPAGVGAYRARPSLRSAAPCHGWRRNETPSGRSFGGVLRPWVAVWLLVGFCANLAGAAPVRIIFDTDIGNDVDDVLALSMLHALETRGVCELLAVTITKPDELAGPFVDAMNTFYGHPHVPIGFTRAGLKDEPSKFLLLADAKDDGKPRYPHRVKKSSDLPSATDLMRKTLAREADDSVVIVQVGYFSNLAALLDTPPDKYSPLSGRELAAKKIKLVALMAGAFRDIGQNRHFLEYNVTQDLAAARKVAEGWPTPMVWSGFEIGIAVPYPARSIERDFGYVKHHPAAEAYVLYNPPPHERPTWDLTAVLYAAFPDRGYFDTSDLGQVKVDADGLTRFEVAPDGRDRYLRLSQEQAVRVKEALVQLASEPPNCLK